MTYSKFQNSLNSSGLSSMTCSNLAIHILRGTERLFLLLIDANTFESSSREGICQQCAPSGPSTLSSTDF